jgi:hypothetical protein
MVKNLGVEHYRFCTQETKHYTQIITHKEPWVRPNEKEEQWLDWCAQSVE